MASAYLVACPCGISRRVDPPRRERSKSVQVSMVDLWYLSVIEKFECSSPECRRCVLSMRSGGNGARGEVVRAFDPVLT